MSVSSRIAAGMTSAVHRDAPDGSDALVAFVRLLARQAAAEASRGVQPRPAPEKHLHTPSRLPRLLTVKEAAQLLHVSTKTIDRWRLDGTLPFLKLADSFGWRRARSKPSCAIARRAVDDDP